MNLISNIKLLNINVLCNKCISISVYIVFILNIYSSHHNSSYIYKIYMLYETLKLVFPKLKHSRESMQTYVIFLHNNSYSNTRSKVKRTKVTRSPASGFGSGCESFNEHWGGLVPGWFALSIPDLRFWSNSRARPPWLRHHRGYMDVNTANHAIMTIPHASLALNAESIHCLLTVRFHLANPIRMDVVHIW